MSNKEILSCSSSAVDAPGITLATAGCLKGNCIAADLIGTL